MPRLSLRNQVLLLLLVKQCLKSFIEFLSPYTTFLFFGNFFEIPKEILKQEDKFRIRMDTSYHDRIARLPMAGSPIPTILISVVYLIFVKILGPAWMRDRKPYDLRGLLIAHNFTLVIANAWMFYKFWRHGWFWSWTCTNIDYLETEDSLAMIEVGWFFFVSKFLEMADTVFFVLRKKTSQITFLHVVHHASVPIIIWYCDPGSSGFSACFGLLNTFVHVWMYLYYGLAALGPSIQKYLWWKKYLTILQMLQFCLVIVATISVIATPGCEVSERSVAFNIGPAVIFLALFANYYRNAYKTQRRTKSSENGRKLSNMNSEDLNGDSGDLNNNLSHDD